MTIKRKISYLIKINYKINIIIKKLLLKGENLT